MLAETYKGYILLDNVWKCNTPREKVQQTNRQRNMCSFVFLVFLCSAHFPFVASLLLWFDETPFSAPIKVPVLTSAGFEGYCPDIVERSKTYNYRFCSSQQCFHRHTTCPRFNMVPMTDVHVRLISRSRRRRRKNWSLIFSTLCGLLSYLFPNCKMYLSKLRNSICPNCKVVFQSLLDEEPSLPAKLVVKLSQLAKEPIVGSHVAVLSNLRYYNDEGHHDFEPGSWLNQHQT